MKLFVPSLDTPLAGVQLVAFKSGLCRKVKPVEGYGQEIFRLLPECVIANGEEAGAALAAAWPGSTSRPKKSKLPDWVSRMKKMNG